MFCDNREAMMISRKVKQILIACLLIPVGWAMVNEILKGSPDDNLRVLFTIGLLAAAVIGIVILLIDSFKSR